MAEMRRLSGEFFLRLIGAVVGATILGLYGMRLNDAVLGAPVTDILVLILVGFLAGLILTPYLTTRPLWWLRRTLVSMSAARLFAMVVGTFLGLLTMALVSPVFALLPSPLREILPLVVAFVLGYSAYVILTLRLNDVRSFVGSVTPMLQANHTSAAGSSADERTILLDTSVIIDGRIIDISKTGFLRSTLLVPHFVLSELQHIADSSDALRRNRGRRGLDILNMLQKDSPVPVRVTDMDVSEVRDVDSKLVALARELACPIMTNDYNLNRVAELQGVLVLNINELANAVKAVYLPGEDLAVKIIQEGKEEGQGVGFLDDGTMVVIDRGRDRLHETVTVMVTKVLQTSAGRMIFARFP